MATRELRVVITGDPRGFQAALAKASGSTNAFATKQRSTAGKVTAAGTAMSKGLTLPLIAAGAASVKLAANFEQQMSAVGAVANATAGDMDKLRKAALTMGSQFGFSAQQVGQAEEELAKGGLTAKTILGGGLRSALVLARAGSMDLAEAATITANALNLFGLSGKQAGKVADAMATAANATTADVSDFGMALAQSGSVAKSAGLSFDDTMVALEALAKSGIKNSDAGTSLKTALIQLIKPTDKQRTLTNKLGLSFLDSHHHMKSLSDISATLRDKLGGMSKAQRTAYLATLAGTDGVRTLTALYDAGPKKLDAYARGLGKTGTAADVASAKQDNLKGDLTKLTSAMQNLGIIVGTAIIPPLSTLAQKVTPVVSSMAAAFSHLSPHVKMVGLAVAGVVAIAGPLLVVFGSIATAIAAIGAPVLIAVAALVALGAGFVYAYKHSEALRNGVGAVVSWLKSNVPPAFEAVKGAAGAAFAWLSTNAPKAFDAIKNAAQTVARVVGPILHTAFDAAKTAVLALASAIGPQLGPAFAAIKSTLSAVVPLVVAIGARFLDLVGIVRSVISFLMPVLGPAFKVAWALAVATVREAVAAIGQVFRGVLGVIRGIVQILTGILTGDFGKMWQGVKSLFVGALNAIVGLVRLALVTGFGKIGGLAMRALGGAFRLGLTAVKGIARTVAFEAVNVITKLTGPARAAGRALIGAVGSAIRGGLGLVGGAARAVGNAAVSAVRGLLGAMEHSGSALVRALAGAIRGLIGAVRSAAGAVGRAAIAGFRALVGEAAGIGRAIVQGLINGIKGLAGAAAAAAKNVVKGALDGAKSLLHIGSPSKVTHQYGEWFSEGLANGINAGAHLARAAATTLGTGVVFELEAQIADARAASDKLTELFARTDKAAEVSAARRRASRRIVGVDHLKGNAREKAKSRNDDIRQARRDLKDLQRDAARANQLAQIDFKIKGLERVKAFNDAIVDVRNSLGQIAESAAQAFRDTRTKAIDGELSNSLLALDTTFKGALERSRKGIAADPRLAELNTIKARQDKSARDAEDAELDEKMANARKKLASATAQVTNAQAALDRVAGSGSQRLISAAQQRLTLAQAAETAGKASVASVEADRRKVADARRADELQAEIDNAQAIAQDRADAAKDGLDTEVAAFQDALNAKFTAEADSLAARTQSYARFAKDVAAILTPLGLVLPTSADTEAAITAPAPAAPAAAPGTKKKAKHKAKTKHHAQGGTVMARLGEFARINELGPETVFLPHGARVATATQTAGRYDGPLIGTVNIHEAGKLNEQAIAEKLGFRLATRRR